MFRVLTCVVDRHDLRLVLLAALLCLFACISAMIMLRCARAASGKARLAWLASAGVVAGCGIWATHFVAMLALAVGFPLGHAWDLTVLSALIAISLSCVGFAIAARRNCALLGGALVGAAVGAMHYVGIAALRAPAVAIWDWRYTAASVSLGIGLSAVSLGVALWRDRFGNYGAGGSILALAICAMHFTGMSAVVFKFDPRIAPPLDVMEPTTLAIAVATIAAFIVAMGLAGALIYGRLAVQRKYIGELEASKAALERTSRNLSLALAAADAASRAKSSFLAAMGHELKTPLNAVIGFSEMLTLAPFGPLGDARYRDYANDIRNGGVRLLAIVSDILDASRFESGEAALECEDLDLSDVIAAAIDAVAPQAKAGGVVLGATIEPGLPQLRADRRLLGQALNNLLCNAVRFTPKDGTVEVRAAADARGIIICVRDTGIGIAAQDIPRALERFGQVDGRLARKYEGVGLGLPLAKQIAELHGGVLSLVSQPGAGTTVTLLLPAARIVPQVSDVRVAA